MNAPSVPVSGSGAGRKKGSDGVHAIITARDVMAQLVAAENREDRQRCTRTREGRTRGWSDRAMTTASGR